MKAIFLFCYSEITAITFWYSSLHLFSYMYMLSAHVVILKEKNMHFHPKCFSE